RCSSLCRSPCSPRAPCHVTRRRLRSNSTDTPPRTFMCPTAALLSPDSLLCLVLQVGVRRHHPLMTRPHDGSLALRRVLRFLALLARELHASYGLLGCFLRAHTVELVVWLPPGNLRALSDCLELVEPLASSAHAASSLVHCDVLDLL